MPATPMAEGAPQAVCTKHQIQYISLSLGQMFHELHLLPSGCRARTRPLPTLPDHRNPALMTEKMARPLAFFSIAGGM